MFKIFCVVLLILWVNCGKHERKLIEKLFADYDINERPVEDEADSVEVKVGMSLQQIIDLDEKEQVLKCSGWMDYGWQDHNLKWNPNEYGNMTTLRVNAAKIWTPDIILYNSADDSFVSALTLNAIIHYTGTVKYLPPTIFKSTCEIAIHNFPFDEQKCELKFGSWTHDESKINITALSSYAQVDAYKENAEWILRDVISYRESLKYDCCAEKYPFVKFIIHIKRRTLYFIFNLIFPCVLISLMTFLGFALPPDSGEKVALEITTLLSIIMFLQLITGIIPESSQAVPTIGVYFASVMLICTVSVVANVVILVFHHRNVKIYKMPMWIRKYICGWLASVLKMRISTDHVKAYPLTKIGIEMSTSSSKSLMANIIDERTNEYVLNDDFGIIMKRPKLVSSQQTSIDSSLATSRGDDLMPLKFELNLILEELCKITSKLKEEEKESQQELEWKFAAMVLDKLCLYLFCVLTLASTGYFFLKY